MTAFRSWFGARGAKPSDRFVKALMEDPASADVEWLARVATAGDQDRARWELRYLRRSLGLLVAQRDALDDRTASTVAHSLTESMAADRNVAAPMIKLAERQFNERLSAYREMMAMRGTPEGIAERVGRTMLLLAGASRLGAEDGSAVAELVEGYIQEASRALQAAFGAASTPGASPPGTPHDRG